MKTWKRAGVRQPCGAQPNCAIAVGDPYLYIEGRDGAWRKYRCAKHAGEPAPETIDESPQFLPKVAKPEPAFSSLKGLVSKFDHKAKQAGEKE